jgi:hypothetical protein
MSVLTECELERIQPEAIHLFPLPHTYPFIFSPLVSHFFSCRCKDTLFSLSPSKKDLHAPSWGIREKQLLRRDCEEPESGDQTETQGQTRPSWEYDEVIFSVLEPILCADGSH